jgi:hypothetical protein
VYIYKTKLECVVLVQRYLLKGLLIKEGFVVLVKGFGFHAIEILIVVWSKSNGLKKYTHISFVK